MRAWRSKGKGNRWLGKRKKSTGKCRYPFSIAFPPIFLWAWSQMKCARAHACLKAGAGARKIGARAPRARTFGARTRDGASQVGEDETRRRTESRQTQSRGGLQDEYEKWTKRRVSLLRSTPTPCPVSTRPPLIGQLFELTFSSSQQPFGRTADEESCFWRGGEAICVSPRSRRQQPRHRRRQRPLPPIRLQFQQTPRTSRYYSQAMYAYAKVEAKCFGKRL